MRALTLRDRILLVDGHSRQHRAWLILHKVEGRSYEHISSLSGQTVWQVKYWCDTVERCLQYVKY